MGRQNGGQVMPESAETNYAMVLESQKDTMGRLRGMKIR